MKKLILTLISIVSCVTTSRATLAFSDTFNYANGGIVTNSVGVWAANTGTANSMLASNQQLIVSSSRQEDIVASLGSTYATNGATVALYSSFTLKCTALPGTSGAYFAHFTGPNANGPFAGHRARIWATTTNFAGIFPTRSGAASSGARRSRASGRGPARCCGCKSPSCRPRETAPAARRIP